MLALTRRRNEVIELDWNGTIVTVHVVQIRKDSVRIAVDAPKYIHILRAELSDRREEVITDLPASEGPCVSEEKPATDSANCEVDVPWWAKVIEAYLPAHDGPGVRQ